jgi:hypothetical protein
VTVCTRSGTDRHPGARHRLPAVTVGGATRNHITEQVRGALWYAVPRLGYLTELLTGEQRRRGVAVVAAVLLGYAALMAAGAARDRQRARKAADQRRERRHERDAVHGGHVAGATSAEVFRVKNAGSVPFTYTITGGLGGTDAAAYAAAGALRLSISAGATCSGTGNAATCTGGTALVTDAALTATTGTTLVATAQGPVAAGTAGAPLCFQVAFASTAPSSLQGRTATATFDVTATSAP